MLETYLRIILFLGLLCIGFFWKLTSPVKSFRDYLNSLTKPSGWIVIFFQILPFLQIMLFTKLFIYQAINIFWLQALGFIVFLLGLAFASWAKWVMKTSWGRPGQHDIRVQQKLVTTGPFRFSRNPIYLGFFLIFLGVEIVFFSYLILLAIPLLIFLSQIIKKEEILLEKYFGKAYLDYQYRVPRFFSLYILLKLIE